jgi:capsular exopolysaccharide synthesis family protein
MREEYIDNVSKEEEDSFQSIQKFLALIFRRWYWLLLSVGIGLLIAWYITSNSEPVYKVAASVLVRDPEKSSTSMGELIYGEKFMKTGSNIENEVFLIRRYKLVRSTLEELGYQTIVYEETNPLRIAIDTSSLYIPHGTLFNLNIRNQEKYTLSTENEDLQDYVDGKEFSFGEDVEMDGFRFAVFLDRQGFVNYLKELKRKEKETDEAPKREVAFQVNDLDKLATGYISSLEVEPLDEKSSIFELSLESTWPQKEVRFLNALTQNYISSDLEEKVSVASQTMDFLDQQLTYISDTLNRIEDKREVFKRENTIDLSKEGSQLYENIQELEKQRSEYDMRMKYLDYLETYVRSDKEGESLTVPTVMGMNDPVLNSQVEELVKQQIELQKAKVGGRGPENPVVTRKKELVASLKSNILETVNNMKSNDRMTMNSINNRIGSHTAQLRSLPAAEREFIDIERKYNLSETLYLFLMEKRTESGIARASTAPDFKIVDEARIQNNGRPVAPNPMMNYATAVMLGLLIPVAFIYVSDKVNNKIYTQEELLSITNIPLLGMVGKNKTGEEVIINHSQSAVAESFRSIRSSLRYMADFKPASKTFMLSSAISGEGKSFCAKNLAYIFSISGKNTIYINTDLRKHNSYEEFGLDKTTGLSDYLIDVVPQEAIVHRTKFSNLYVIPAGELPPNPSELLMTEKFKDLMAYLKQHFHYIIMDAPPRGILSDGMELVKYADVEIFVIRQGYTQKPHVENLNRMYRQERDRMPAAGIIFNDVDFDKLEYGFKQKSAYGYNYFAEDEKPWWRRVFNS